jgi:hypothetical protein
MWPMVAKAIVRVVDLPFGKRPFRVHIDPAQDGAEIVNGVADRVRAEMYRNIGLSDLLAPWLVAPSDAVTSDNREGSPAHKQL